MKSAFRTAEDINLKINDYRSTSCLHCLKSDLLEEWLPPKKVSNAFLITIGFLCQVQIPVMLCTGCGVLNYPKMIQYGVFPLHNKCLVSLDFVMEVKDVLVTG